jgi:hypothetical protein
LPKRFMWESKVLGLPDDLELQQEELDEVALDGWRLVSVDKQRAYLIRRAPVTTIAEASQPIRKTS